MADDLELVDDEMDETMALNEGEGDELALDEDDRGRGAEEEEEGDEGEADEGDYAPAESGTAFTVMLGFSCLAYIAAIAVVMYELKSYCDPEQFPF